MGGWEPALLITAVGTPGHAGWVGCGAGRFPHTSTTNSPAPISYSPTTASIKQFDGEKQKRSAWLPLEPLLGCKEGSPAIQIPLTRGLAKWDGVFMKAKTAWTIRICIFKMFVEAVSTEQQKSSLNIYEETRWHTNSSFVFQIVGLVIKFQENRHTRRSTSPLVFTLAFLTKPMTHAHHVCIHHLTFCKKWDNILIHLFFWTDTWTIMSDSCVNIIFCMSFLSLLPFCSKKWIEYGNVSRMNAGFRQIIVIEDTKYVFFH